MVEKAPQRQQLPSGKIIDHCSYGSKWCYLVWLKVKGICRILIEKKAAHAGIDE